MPALRALALLVDRVAAWGAGADDRDLPPHVRDVLRQLLARTRGAPLVMTVTDGVVSLDGAPLDRNLVADDPLLLSLHQRLVRGNIALVSIRDAVGPGELLTLARLLTAGAAGASVQTPTEARAFGSTHRSGNELLRTWSIIVRSNSTGSDGSTGELPVTPPRSDERTKYAVSFLIDDLEELIAANDARAIEQVARFLHRSIETTGSGGGRLALEAGMRKLLRSDAISLLASRVPYTIDQVSLTAVLSRAGESAVRALMNGLSEATTTAERRAFFDAIVSADAGGALLRDSLTDSRWFVVRNAVALIGEMGVREADRDIAALLQNEDTRLRIAAARALVRLRTPHGLHALQASIVDENPEVRRIAATAFALATTTHGAGRPATTPLADALERESDEDVALEMLAALGRLGSADAVQRLLRIAQSPSTGSYAAVGAEGRGYAPHSSWMRIAALEALVDARGAAVASTVESLTGDEDMYVADAARRLIAQ